MTMRMEQMHMKSKEERLHIRVTNGWRTYASREAKTSVREASVMCLRAIQQKRETQHGST